MKDLELDNLLKSYITKVCRESKLPDMRLDAWFTGEYSKLIDKLVERKNDLPSVDYLVKAYKFEPIEDSYTLTDVVELLKSKYARARYAKVLQEAKLDFSNDVHYIAVLEKSIKELTKTRGVVSETSTTCIDEETESIVDDYLKWQEHKDPIVTGFERLDIDAPLRRGEVVLIIGNTNSGKSLIVSKMAAENIKSSIPSTIVSLEMSRLQVMRRILPIVTEGAIKNSHVRDGLVRVGELENALKIVKTPFNIITRMNSALINVRTIESHLEEMSARNKCPHVVYIDYFNLLDQDTNWNAEESISGQLKRLALQYNVMIVLLAQTDTTTMKDGKFPDLMSVAGNKGIVRDCDTVFSFLTTKNTDGTLIMDFKMLKRRDDGGFIDWSCKVDPDKGDWKETITQQL